jgi:hypothetical protein
MTARVQRLQARSKWWQARVASRLKPLHDAAGPAADHALGVDSLTSARSAAATSSITALHAPIAGWR